ncbi:extracellular solute-binding protein [Actinomyces respiraculi]|uniref:Extracellular solute-binding protein n=2 Tax=Actinomycetaceae TaxID=2049 RepID=A0A7T0PXB6_9ACTO|nr:extracellular solute-binding protein [Actinomyces respiraculi]
MKTSRRGFLALGTVATATVGLAACGGGGSTTTADGKPIVTVQVVKDSRTAAMADLAWTTSLQEAAGCSIQWLETPSASWDQQKKASLAAGDVADITIGGFGSGDMADFGSLFMDLTPELGSLPNVQAMFDAEPYARVVSTTTDGKILGTPTVARSITARSSNHMFINKQWLDTLGLAVPTTWDELETCLEAFKNGDPTGTGARVIPLDFNAPGTDGFGLFNPNVLLSSRGITVSSGALGMYAQDGVVKNYLTDPAYKELIVYLRRLWEKGLISEEAFTHDWSAYTSTSKGDGDVAKVGVTWMWTPSDIFGSTLGSQYVTIPALQAQAGQSEKTVWTYNGDDLAYQANRAVVSANPSNKEAALAVVNAFYSADMTVQMRYGAFDTCVTRNAENDYTVLEPADSTKNASDWQFTNALADGAPGWIRSEMKLELPPEHTEYREVDAVYHDNYANIDLNRDVLYSNMPQTPEQSRTLAKNATGINQNAMSRFAQWITQGGVENEWDDYVAGLEANNLAESIAVQQEIYDSYKAQMDKLGVDLNSLSE